MPDPNVHAIALAGPATHDGNLTVRLARLTARALNAIAFAGLTLLLRAVVTVNFRHARVFGRAHFPARGAALVVANHPATWTDVVVLDVLLGRKLHFLALEELFHAWPGRWLLALHGALPVFTESKAPDRARHNADTLAASERMLARGEVVAMFPEGVSQSDGNLLPLRPGAARLALAYRAHARGALLPIVPVGLRYSDRTAFQGDVVLDVGEPVAYVDLADGARVPSATEHDAVVGQLTARIESALAGCVARVEEPGERALVRVLEGVACELPTLRERERLRLLSLGLADVARRDPGEHERLARAARRYVRLRRALRLTDRALVQHGGGRLAPLWAGLWTLGMAVVLVPALAGALLHALPAAVIQRFSARYRGEPPRVTFARIGGGLVLFPPWYAALGVWAVQARALPLELLPALWAVFAVLGLLAIHARRWLGVGLEVARVTWLGARFPRLLLRARSGAEQIARAARRLHARGEELDQGRARGGIAR